jgi:hypothetical protein
MTNKEAEEIGKCMFIALETIWTSGEQEPFAALNICLECFKDIMLQHEKIKETVEDCINYEDDTNKKWDMEVSLIKLLRNKK